MDDQDERLPGGGVRRVGRKDRKQSIEPREPLFPDEEEFPPLEEPGQQPVTAYTPPEERFPPVSLPEEDRLPPEPADYPRRRRRWMWQDTVALLFLFATCGMLAYFAVIINDPYSPLNLLAPPTPLPVMITTTPLPATPTSRPTIGPSPSFTPLLLVTDPFSVTPATSTPSAYPFTLADAGVVYIPNGNSEACNWSSIAGSVTGLQGEPLNGYGVHVVGDALEETVFSGSALTFGPGGYELPLGGVPREAQYTVQLLTAAGTPVSDTYPITTRATCEANVAIVSFVQNREF